MCGHSSGEIAAAFCASIFDLRSCMELAYYGGRDASALRKSQEGAMMTIAQGPEVVEPLLESLETGFAIIACYNSPQNVTVSGDRSAVEELKVILNESRIFRWMLNVDVAYHSGERLFLDSAR